MFRQLDHLKEDQTKQLKKEVIKDINAYLSNDTIKTPVNIVNTVRDLINASSRKPVNAKVWITEEHVNVALAGSQYSFRTSKQTKA